MVKRHVLYDITSVCHVTCYTRDGPPSTIVSRIRGLSYFDPPISPSHFVFLFVRVSPSLSSFLSFSLFTHSHTHKNLHSMSGAC